MSASNGIDIGDITFDVDQIEKDIEAVFKKHIKKLKQSTGIDVSNNVALSLEKSSGQPKGFYCIFMKRDDTKPEDDKYSSVALGFDMRFDEVYGIMAHTLANMMEEDPLEQLPTA